MIRLWANINNNNIIYFKLATVVAAVLNKANWLKFLSSSRAWYDMNSFLPEFLFVLLIIRRTMGRA